MGNVKIYDNGGKTQDRYTAIFMDRPETLRGPSGTWRGYEALAFDGNPFHPMGFGQHITAAPNRGLGRRVALDALPTQARQFVLYNMQES